MMQNHVLGQKLPMFSIGEFSKITGLTVKTLRFYHDQDLLIPAFVDEQSGYRYYNASQIETARIIAQLRGLEFTLEQIREILRSAESEPDLLAVLEQQRAALKDRARHVRTVIKALDHFILLEQETRMATSRSTYQVEEKSVASQLIAGVRMQGRYSDCGKAFAKIGRAFGRHICGPCFLLHYDSEFKDGDADFEACMPVRKPLSAPGISVRELPGGRCVSLLHPGPYEELGRSYAKILEYARTKGYTVAVPTREVYLKGPGMIFRGNPKNYLTEIQLLHNATE